jgi:beta-glucosidase
VPNKDKLKENYMRKKLAFYSAMGFMILQVLAAVSAHGQGQMSSTPPSDLEDKINSILQKMTLEEKIDLLGGTDGFYARGIPRLNMTRLKMADGPIGVRNFGPATAMAGGIALAATWNLPLAERVGTEIGRDARSKGANFLLGPGVNIYRSPLNGRNFEYFGEDPFLASRFTVGYINGVQSQGVSATVKHFMANNSEFDRHNTDSIIDERTMREIYLPTFEAAVKEAHVGAIMNSYNLINGSHATQNDWMNNQVAKKEWGFDGIIMSDWTSTYDTAGAANGGLDLEMPSGRFLNKEKLLPLIKEGKVSESTIDDKIRRMLRLAFRFGWYDREQTDLSIPRLNWQGRQAALQSARESMVLLKNEANLLPLSKSKIKTIAVIGPNSFPAVPVGGGSARVEPFSSIGFLEGISNYSRDSIKVLSARGIPTLPELADRTNFKTTENGTETGLRAKYFKEDVSGTPEVSRIDQHVNFGDGARQSFPPQTSASSWTGYFTPQRAGDHEIFVQTTGEAGGAFRLYVDDKLVFDNWTSSKALLTSTTQDLNAQPHKIVFERKGRPGFLGSRLRFGIVRSGTLVEDEALKIAAQADVVVLTPGFNPESESEGADRTFRLPPGQDELINKISAANKKTVVIMTSGGNVDMNSWVENVPVLIEAWYSGEQGGNALAEILFGDVNPSGKLPVTFERYAKDNPTFNNYYPAQDTKKVVYGEGVFVGYRGYEHDKITPRFPFGYGLSYTSFSYSGLNIQTVNKGLYKVTFTVKNTGKVAGAEVAEIYVGEASPKLPRPEKELKGFSKVELRPGESRTVSVLLNSRAFAYYDTAAQKWTINPGTFNVMVGRSSQQIDLRGTLKIDSAIVY